MADKASYESYQKSGFDDAAGTAGLQEQVGKIPTSDDALREQAVEQYADTYKTLDQSYAKQITNLIASQATDEKLLNEQYNNSISSMMAQLQKRGLHVTGSLPQAQTAALNKHRNDVMTMRQNIYRLQRDVPEKQKQQLATDYEKAISQRVAANRATNVPTLTELLAQISSLQSSSFEAYIDHILAKKAKGSGSGGGYRRSYSSGGSSASAQSSFVDPSSLAGNTYKVVDIYAGGAARRQTNGGKNARQLTSTTQDGSKYSF